MKKLLVVDDQEHVLRLVKAIVSRDNRFEAILARDGRQAIEIAQKEHPDAIFVDILMPGMDGYEVCREIKTNPITAGTIVIMFSAFANDYDTQKSSEVKADGYFAKPFNPSLFIHKVEEALGLPTGKS